MQWEHIAFISTLIVASIVTGTLAFFAYYRRHRPGAKGFMALMLTIMLYSVGYAFELTCHTLPQVMSWIRVEYLGNSFLPFFLIIMVSGYAGLEIRKKPWLVFVSLPLSLTTLILNYTNEYHHLYYRTIRLGQYGSFPVVLLTRGPWYWVQVIYVYSAMAFCIIILFQMRRREGPLFRKQSNIIIWSMLVPWLASLFYLFGLNPLNLDLVPFGFTIMGLIAARGLFFHRIFDLSPIAREKLFENIRDGVIVLDLGNRIVDYNPTAKNILQELNPVEIGRPGIDIGHDYPELAKQVASNLEWDEFYVTVGTSRKCIESRLSLISSEAKESIGKMIILSDITEQKQALAQMIQAEKMAVLGQLVANVAHELNTPLAAIKAMAENIEPIFERLWQQIPGFLVEPNHQKQLLETLEKIQDPPRLSTREERDSLRKLTLVLQEQGLESAGEIVRHIVKLGLAEDFDRLIPVLRDRKDAALLEFILEMAVVRKNVRNILQAEEKTAKTVYTLKSYTHTTCQSQPVLSDVRTGVETVLQIYENLIKNNVQLIADFHPVPPIWAYPDELQQVWTNLMHNAIQAMEGTGELRIDIEQKGDEVVVGFTDNGPGIGEDLLPKIFEPLFTTKRAGEGSGLGLTICRGIVERHQGRIEVQSKPGRTRFLVYLPLIKPDCWKGGHSENG